MPKNLHRPELNTSFEAGTNIRIGIDKQSVELELRLLEPAHHWLEHKLQSHSTTQAEKC